MFIKKNCKEVQLSEFYEFFWDKVRANSTNEIGKHQKSVECAVVLCSSLTGTTP